MQITYLLWKCLLLYNVRFFFREMWANLLRGSGRISTALRFSYVKSRPTCSALIQHRNPPCGTQVQNQSTTSSAPSPMAFKHQPEELRQLWPGAAFNVEKMTDLLDHDNLEMRQQFREFVSDPVMTPKYNIPLDEV